MQINTSEISSSDLCCETVSVHQKSRILSFVIKKYFAKFKPFFPELLPLNIIEQLLIVNNEWIFG